MKTVTRTKVVEYQVYIAKDGKRGLYLYKAEYHNTDGQFFARTKEYFEANFEDVI